MMSKVESGRETRERESRSSIWMSVALRSWAARTASSFSGWEARDGGERRRVRGGLAKPFVPFEGGTLKSEDVSMVTEGAIAMGEREESSDLIGVGSGEFQ